MMIASPVSAAVASLRFQSVGFMPSTAQSQKVVDTVIS